MSFFCAETSTKRRLTAPARQSSLRAFFCSRLARMRANRARKKKQGFSLEFPARKKLLTPVALKIKKILKQRVAEIGDPASAQAFCEHLRGGSRTGPVVFLFCLLLLFSFSSAGWIWKESLSSKDKKARELYKGKKMDEALSEWRGAQIDHPENNELQYNIGNALHNLGRHEDAYKEYEKILGSKNDELKEKTYYNMGNTNFRMGKLKEAISSYKEALSIDPDDEDAKYNIELIKKLLKKQKQKSQNNDSKKDRSKEKDKKDQGKGSKEDQEKKERQEDQGKGQSEENKKEQQGQKEKEEKQGQEDKSQKSGQEKGQEKKEGKKSEMSKEDAKRLLDALKDDEEEVQKQLMRHMRKTKYNVEKDW